MPEAGEPWFRPSLFKCSLQTYVEYSPVYYYLYISQRLHSMSVDLQQKYLLNSRINSSTLIFHHQNLERWLLSGWYRRGLIHHQPRYRSSHGYKKKSISVVRSLVLCVVFCKSLVFLFLLTIMLSDLLRFTLIIITSLVSSNSSYYVSGRTWRRAACIYWLLYFNGYYMNVIGYTYYYIECIKWLKSRDLSTNWSTVSCFNNNGIHLLDVIKYHLWCTVYLLCVIWPCSSVTLIFPTPLLDVYKL